MELASVVGLRHLLFDFREFGQNPTVQTGQLLIPHGVFRGRKIVQIRELIAQGIAQTAIAFGDFSDSILAYDHIIAKVLRSYPKSDDVRSPFINVSLRTLRLRVTTLSLFAAFADFIAVGIDHETVGDDALKGGGAISGQGE